MDRSDERAVLLSAERERLVAKEQKLTAELDALVRARHGESDDDEHDPEGETLSSRWSLLSGLLESARDDVRRADAAVQRLASGHYGICEVCGEPIPEGQLEARPLRERCVPCDNAR